MSSKNLLHFEETPLTINPLPAGEVSPFKVVFEGDFTIKRISIAFKNASGQPIPAVDKRKKREWVEVEINDEDEHVFSSQGILPEMEQRSDIIELTEPSEEMVTEKGMKISIGTIPPLVREVGSFPWRRDERRAGRNRGNSPRGILFSNS